MLQKTINGLPKKDYFKKYYEDNKEKIAECKKKYREDNKEKIAEYKKKYCEDKIKHQRDHPEQYLKVFNTNVYTNGVTEEMKKQLPKLISKKIKEMLLDEVSGNSSHN